MIIILGEIISFGTVSFKFAVIICNYFENDIQNKTKKMTKHKKIGII